MPVLVAVQHVATDQPGGVRGGGGGGHLVGGVVLGHAAVVEHQQPVGEGEDVDRVVGDQHRDALEAVQVLGQLLAQGLGDGHVERRERLVEQQHARIGRQRPGHRHPLRLPAGQLAGTPLGEVADAEPVEQVPGPTAGLAAPHATRAGTEGDVLQGAEVGEERVLLVHQADLALVRGQRVPRAAVDADRPGVPGRAGEGAQQGRLSRAVGPDQGDHLARIGREGDLEQVVGALDPHLRLEHAHDRPPSAPPVSQRSRSETRASTHTASSTTLSATAVSRSPWSPV